MITITIASATNEDINLIVAGADRSFDKSQEPAKNIPGLVTRRFDVHARFKSIHQFREFGSSNQLWIQFPELNTSNNANLQPQNTRVSFGSFKTLSEFRFHRWIQGMRVDWKSKAGEIHVINGQDYFRLGADSLDTYFVFDPPNSLYLPLKKPVNCFKKIGEEKPKRIFNFTQFIPSFDLADTSTICLALPTHVAYSFRKYLVENFQLDCFYPVLPITSRRLGCRSNYNLTPEADFLSAYAWEMLLSLGFRIKDNIDEDLMDKVNELALHAKNSQYPNHPFYAKMVAIYNRAKNNRFFDVVTEFDGIKPIWLPPKQPGYDYTPRIVLTPYGQYPKTLKAMRSNRVFRQAQTFGPPLEHFCRVLLRDCDLECLQDFTLKEWRPVLKEILLTNGLIVGRQKYDFLLFSNSQLRDRSLSFYRRYRMKTVDDIYKWLGQFNHEKSVGTRLARMAQCFTSTIHGIQISSSALEEIPDKFDSEGRCFTDGCGRISSSLLKQLMREVYKNELGRDQPPSVIQIRCSGLKGVLVNTPQLTGDKIQYRPSQKKFSSDHYFLELVNYSQPKGLYFNQQAITLLEFMGVPTSLFVEFQYISRKRLSMALISKKSAISMLRRTIRFYDWEQINKSGFVIPQEPFFRSLLMTLCQDNLQKLCNKSHLHVPMEDGRMLYGVVDETDSLEEGEVFIQITEESREGKETRRIIKNTKSLVTRMPCHHPGDILLLKAVDKPKLHHLVDCIVFPAKGSRPHPTEMSGGDLDGDEYWACWNMKLVDAVQFAYEADQYVAPKKPVCLDEPTKEMLVDCILNILENSGQVGVLSRRHLALSAAKDPDHRKAIELARAISDALDFPKTGVSSMTREKYRDLNVFEYPDFMQNPTKEVFPCDKTLGVLFKYMKETLDIHLSVKSTMETNVIDKDLLVPGFQKYKDRARSDYADFCEKISSILNTYSLKSETELITGTHFTTPEEPHTGDDVEIATQDFRALRTKIRQEFIQMSLSRQEKEMLVSAYYYVTYASKRENQETYLSFPWMFYDILCEIKNRTSKTSEADNDQISHQSHQMIGNALLASRQCRQTFHYHRLSHLCQYWLNTELENHEIWNQWFNEIDSFIDNDERFQAVEQSDACTASQLGEQFLLLLDYLLTRNNEEFSFEPVTNLFLYKLHRIALKMTI